MIDKLEEIKHRFEEVGQLIVQPDIVTDMEKYGKLNKEYKDLEKIVVKYKEFTEAASNLNSAYDVLGNEKDPEFREMAKAEIDELEPLLVSIEEESLNDTASRDNPSGRITECKRGWSCDDRVSLAPGHHPHLW